MLIASFVEQATGKVSAAKFLAQHREWLLGFERVCPVMQEWEQGKLLPTPALFKLLPLLMREKDKVSSEIVKAAKVKAPSVAKVKGPTMIKEAKPRAEKLAKAYLVVIYTVNGWKVDSTLEADAFGDAERMAHNKLYRMTSDSYAEVIGHGVKTKVTYLQAVQGILARRLGGKQSSVGMGRRNAELGSKMSVRNDSCHFSHG